MSALSILARIDNARVGDTGRIYYFARSEVWGMLKAYRGKASYLFFGSGYGTKHTDLHVSNPAPFRKGENDDQQCKRVA